MKTPPRGFHELETNESVDEVNYVGEDYREIDMDVDDSNDDVSYVREDCEGIFE